jgi:antitoxin (DNA-binding transcriptional repressor) of toxin-antitoxin stability system
MESDLEGNVMILTNIKDLKARLNHYLRLAEQGKVVVVTRRGKVIAEVHPGGHEKQARPSVKDVMTSLAQQGLLDLPTRSGSVGLEPGVPVQDPSSALRVLDDMIAERKRR